MCGDACHLHIGVGSALLVSTNRAMRRPQRVRRVTGTGSHAFSFFFDEKTSCFHSVWGIYEKEKVINIMKSNKMFVALVAMLWSFTLSASVEVATLAKLQDALAAENELPIIITETIVIPEGETVTIDLNGKTVTVPETTGKHIYALNNKGSLTLKDTKGNGSITARGIYNGYNGTSTDETVAGAKMTIESGKYIGMDTDGGAAIFNCAELVVNGGDFTGGVAAINNRKMGDVTINGGTFHGGNNYVIQNNGGTLTINNASVDSGFGAVGNYSGTTVINDGTYLPTGRAKATCHVVYVAGAANVTINGGTFKMNYPEGSTPDSGSAVASYYNGKLSITGGTFYAHFDNVSPVELSAGSEITGGSYYNHAGVASTHSYVTNFVKKGYTLGEDGKVVSTYAAMIGETPYETLQAAIEAVQEGEIITLVNDVNVTKAAYGANALNHARAISFTLDLNKKKLSADTGNSVFRFNIANSGAASDVTLTIKNGTITAGSNTWCAVMAAGISADVKAIMNLENLTIEASKAGDLAVKSWDNAIINAKNVTVNTTNAAGGFYAVGGEIVLDGCTVNQKGLHTEPYLSMAFAVSTNGKMTINSGTYSAEPTAAAEGYNQGSTHGSWVGGVMNSGGELIINGGTFSNGNFGDDALATAARGLIFADTNGEVTVNGGTFNALKSIFDFQNNLGGTSPVITVKGGSYSADPTKVTSYGYIVLADDCSVKEENNRFIVVEEGLTGEGTEANPYVIDNAEELVLFRTSVNAGETKYSAPGVYVALGADIDLAGQNWVGIGSIAQPHGFMGNFDGKNFKIKNLTITNPVAESDGSVYAGLFSITEGTDQNNQNVIKNLTIENVTISTTGHIVSAAIAYPYYTIVDNVTVCGNISIKGGDYTAGALAYTRRCVNASNITVAGNAGSTITGAQVVGGVISDIQMNGGLKADYSNFSAEGVSITGTKMVGGISGIISEQTLAGASVSNVSLTSGDNRVGIVSGSLGGVSTITGVTYGNVEGATAIVGPTYKGANPVEAKIGDTYYATFEAAMAAEGTDNVALLVDKTITLDDAEAYTYTKGAGSLGVKYTRNLIAGIWNPVYLPFGIALKSDKFEVAEFTSAEGATVTLTKLEANEYGYINLFANTAYVVRPIGDNTTLVCSIWGSIFKNEEVKQELAPDFSVRGNYSVLTGDDLEDNDRVVGTNGNWGVLKSTSTLKPFRLILSVPEGFTPEQSAAISMRVLDNTTGVEETIMDGQEALVIYDLMGRRVETMTEGGIYIVNGKKIVF